MAYNYEEKLILRCLCQEKKFYHQRFVRKRFLHKLPISIAPLKSQMVGPLAGAVTAFACGKINEYFGFWFKKLSKSNSYGTTVEQTKVYWRTDSYVFEGKKVCDTVWAVQPSVVPAPVVPLPTVLLSKLTWCYKCSSTFQTFMKGSCICCLNQGNRLDPVWTNGRN